MWLNILTIEELLFSMIFQIRLYYSPQLLRSSFEKSKGLTDKSPKNLFEKVKQLTAENCNACVTLGQFLSGKWHKEIIMSSS